MAIRKRFTENEIPISIARYERGRFFAIWCRMYCVVRRDYFRIVSCGLAYGVRIALSVG